MIASSIYPWQQTQWKQLIATKAEQQCPHALLLCGSAGIGKHHFARVWSKTLLCTGSSGPCHNCHSCQLMNATSHPDFYLIEPEQVGGMIKIDQIRELVQFVSETALQGHNRVVLIHPASAMNVFSANALLKTLEEPGPNTFFILVNDQQGRLPATILSRCQKLFFNKPTQSEALEWLSSIEIKEKNPQQILLALTLANNAPLKAKEYLESDFLTVRQAFYQKIILLSEAKFDPLQLAAEYQEQDIRSLLNWLLSWIQDVLRFQTTQGQAELINFDFQENIATFAKKLQTNLLLNYYDFVQQIYVNVINNINLNRQLLLENVFLRIKNIG